MTPSPLTTVVVFVDVVVAAALSWRIYFWERKCVFFSPISASLTISDDLSLPCSLLNHNFFPPPRFLLLSPFPSTVYGAGKGPSINPV